MRSRSPSKTKQELIELAAKGNAAKFENPKAKDKPKVPRSAKWFVEHKKIGDMCPGNAGGHYIKDGLDSSGNAASSSSSTFRNRRR